MHSIYLRGLLYESLCQLSVHQGSYCSRAQSQWPNQYTRGVVAFTLTRTGCLYEFKVGAHIALCEESLPGVCSAKASNMCYRHGRGMLVWWCWWWGCSNGVSVVGQRITGHRRCCWDVQYDGTQKTQNRTLNGTQSTWDGTHKRKQRTLMGHTREHTRAQDGTHNGTPLNGTHNVRHEGWKPGVMSCPYYILFLTHYIFFIPFYPRTFQNILFVTWFHCCRITWFGPHVTG